MSTRPPALTEQLSDIRSRIRQALWTNGLGRLAVVTVGLILAACLADWMFHFDDQGVRLILGLSIVAASAWVVYRHLVTPLKVPFSNVDLALRIEDRYPGFQDSLASAVQFLEGRADPQVGSPALQQAVVRETLSRLKHLDCRDVLQTRVVRRVALLAAVVCLVAAVVAALDLRQTSIALRRLFVPFAAPAWPRQTTLRLLNAELEPLGDPTQLLQIASGDQLKLFAENETGSLPTKVTLEYRSSEARVLSEPMRPLSVGGGDSPARELAVGQVPANKGEIQFRAVGGDDDTMAWYRLRVVPPPVVERLQLTLTPPAYTGRPAEVLPADTGHVQGLVGTRVDLAAAISKPVAAAAIRIRDQQRVEVALAPDGQALSGSFVISEPGLYSWRFDLEDEQGFQNADPPRYEVRGIADAEPEIRIDLPASDLQVTADAEVLVRTVARDDLGIKEIRLVFRLESGGEAAPQTILLKAGSERPLEQSVDQTWSLGDLELTEGTRIVFHTEATDDFDLTDVLAAGKPPAPHVGRSGTRTLTVVSKEDKSRELAQRQSGLLDDLERAFQLQRQAHNQIGELQLQMQKAERLRPEDLDMLQRAELGQREVAGQLIHPLSGLERRARNLLDELRDNRLEDPGSERRLTDIAEELGRLGDSNLPVIESELTLARKLAQAGGTARRDAGQARPDRSATDDDTGRAPQQDAPGASSAKKRLAPEDPDQTSRPDTAASPDADSDSGSDPRDSQPADSAAGTKSESDAPGSRQEKSGPRQEKPGSRPGDSGTRPGSKSGARSSNPTDPSAKDDRSPEQGAPDAPSDAPKAASADGRSPAGADSPEPADGASKPDDASTADGASKPARESAQPSSERSKAGSAKARPQVARSPKANSRGGPEDSLETAAANQQEVIESLSEMLKELSEWRSESDAARELSSLVKQQAELNEKTGEVGRQTLSKTEGDLSPQELADQARLAERQKRQADQLGELEARLQEKIEALSKSNPSGAASLKEMLEQAREQGVASQMRDAAGQIGENRMGEASRSQQEILEKLRELENTLGGVDESDAETLVKKLKQAEQELQNQRDGQAELLQKLNEARQIADPAERQAQLERLARRQQELREETDRMARKLQRLQARQPSAAAQRAASRMQQAQADMEAGDEAQAAEQEQEALDDLEQAQRELARERRRAEEQLAREQLEKIASELAGMIDREQAVIAETKRLDDLRKSAGKLNRSQLKSLSELTEVQRGLREDTDRLVEKLIAAEVFAHTLRGAARNMQRAVDLLEQRDTGDSTQFSEESARRRFVDLTEALRQDRDEKGAGGKPPGEAGGGEGGNDQGPPTDGIPAIAQLKMLLSLQRELLERTARLNELKAAGKPLTPDQQQELELLALEQGELADLTRNLSQLAAEPDDAPSQDAPPENSQPENPQPEEQPE